MKLSLYILASSLSLISCVQNQKENSITELNGVNEVTVFLNEPSSPGDRVHFLRLDCKNFSGKMQRCINVPLADGTIKESIGNGHYKIQLDHGGRIEAFSIVRKHEASDRH